MPDSGHVDTYDGSEIAVLCSGVELYSIESLDWNTEQKKEFIRSLGRRKRGKPVNKGSNVIGRSRGDLEISLDLEFKEFNGALLENPVFAERNGVMELESATIDGQTVRCLQDLRGLEIVIRYPVINGIQRKATFGDFEFSKDSGGVKLAEAPGRKASGDASWVDGLV